MRLINSSTKPWVGQFRATTPNARSLMRKCGFARFWRLNSKTHLWFHRFRKILLFFGRNAGLSRVFKGWIGRRTCNIDAIKLIETNVEKKQKDEGVVWAKQSILGPKSRKALGRPISCSHPKREGFDQKMRICAILKGEIEDAPVVSKISCDFVVFWKKCRNITCF